MVNDFASLWCIVPEAEHVTYSRTETKQKNIVFFVVVVLYGLFCRNWAMKKSTCVMCDACDVISLIT
jgi:hypothetical protein